MSESEQTQPKDDTPDRFQFGLPTMFGVTVGVAALCSLAMTVGFVPTAIIATAIFYMAIRDFISRHVPLWLEIVPVLVLVLAGLYVLLSIGLSSAVRAQPPKPACCQNLKMLGVALHDYHSAHGCFPPAYIADESGVPMHSWRTLLLPYMERKSLHANIDLDEPWDGQNNTALHGIYPGEFWCPADTGAPRGQTNYVAVTGPGTMWPGKDSAALSDAVDGPGKTILLVEVVNSGIHWMEPRDIDISELPAVINPKNGKGISSNHTGGAHVLFADGSVRFIPEDITPKQLKALISPAGGEDVDPDEL